MNVNKRTKMCAQEVGWWDSSAATALLALLCSSARTASGSGEVLAFVWNPGARCFIRQGGDGSGDGWLDEHAEVICALSGQEELSFGGRIVLPLPGPYRLEGVLSITPELPLGGALKATLQNLCEMAGAVLTGLREKSEAFRSISVRSLELQTPLVSARGYTRMALEDVDNPASQAQRRYLSAALKNINRLVEVSIGLTHAGEEA